MEHEACHHKVILLLSYVQLLQSSCDEDEVLIDMDGKHHTKDKKRMMETTETTTIDSYMEEELTLTLTRREIYFIRKVSNKRLDAARQGMDALNASPAKRSMRREEYEFHRNLINRLYGVTPTSEEVQSLRMIESANRANELARRAEKLRATAERLTDEARQLLEPAI